MREQVKDNRYILSGSKVPFLSSIVTVSFAHFIRNLDIRTGSAWPPCSEALTDEAQLRAAMGGCKDLT